MAGYDDLVRSVMALQPPLFIFGGVAEDVLFNGCVAHPHSDLDLLMFRDEVHSRLGQFKALGFSDWEVWWQPRPNLPLVYHATNDGIDLEPSVFERDESGASFVIDDARGQLSRVFLPDDAFDYPPITVGDIAYRILSPLCLYQIREAIQLLGPFGDLRAKDHQAQQDLRARILADSPDAVLAPRIVQMQ